MAGGPEFPRHLKVLKQLGRGAYGTVHLCEDSRDGKEVAVKHVRHAARHGKSILREVRLLARLKHDNLLHLLDFPAVSGPDFEDVFLVLPYYPSDLHKVIQSRQALSDKHVQVITCQILRALAHLHAAGVAHRDLKPANILLSSDCRLKVCDFGLARGDMPTTEDDGDEDEQACGVLTEYVVTRWYRAPEIMLLPKHYGATIDLWSVGCILGEILGRRALFPGKNHVDMIVRVAHLLGTPSDDELNWLPKDCDAYRFVRRVCPRSDGVPLSTLFPRATSACLDLLRGLLGWDPARRLTAAEAQEHEYLANYLPKEMPVLPETFDWSFDGFKPTSSAVKERLYKECARFHPEILDREAAALAAQRASRAAPASPRTMPSPRQQGDSTRQPASRPPTRPPNGGAVPTPSLASGYAPPRQTPPIAQTGVADRSPQRQSSTPSSKTGTPQLSSRSSPGYSTRTSPQAPYVGPPRSVVPQPQFATRSEQFAARSEHPVRSLTPQRVLAR